MPFPYITPQDYMNVARYRAFNPIGNVGGAQDGVAADSPEYAFNSKSPRTWPAFNGPYDWSQGAMTPPDPLGDGQGPSSPPGQSTSTGSNLGSMGQGGVIGPMGMGMGPGLAGLAYGLATQQDIDPGYALASVIGTLAGQAPGFASPVGLLGTLAGLIGFSPSMDPHGVNDPPGSQDNSAGMGGLADHASNMAGLADAAYGGIDGMGMSAGLGGLGGLGSMSDMADAASNAAGLADAGLGGFDGMGMSASMADMSGMSGDMGGGAAEAGGSDAGGGGAGSDSGGGAGGSGSGNGGGGADAGYGYGGRVMVPGYARGGRARRPSAPAGLAQMRQLAMLRSLLAQQAGVA